MANLGGNGSIPAQRRPRPRRRARQPAGDGGAAAGAVLHAGPNGDGRGPLAIKVPAPASRASRAATHRLAFSSMLVGPGTEPDCMTRPAAGHDQPHIRSPLGTAAPISRVRRAGLREGAKPFLFTVLLSGHGLVRLARLDRSGLIRPGPVFDIPSRPRCSGSLWLHLGALDHHARRDVFPQCDQ